MKNADQPAFACIDENTHQLGLTKREYACIHLGIPDSGDYELNDLIRKAERKRIAAMAMQGLISNSRGSDYKRICTTAIELADELLKQLES